MLRFIVFLMILVVSVYVGLKVAEDPGFALFTYQNWSVEMPLWLAFLALIVSFYLVSLIVRFFDDLDFSWYRFHAWRSLRRKNKADTQTNRGLVDLIEGDWENAERLLLQGVQPEEVSLINYLAAAFAAHEQHAYDKRDAYLKKAQDIAPHAELAIGLTAARLQLDQSQLEQALATLKNLRHIAPKHKLVLKLLERVYIRLSDWPALLDLIPSLHKAKLIDRREAKIFKKKIEHEMLTMNEKKRELS